MAISVTCRCGNVYSLKDDYAGRPVKCPSCGAITRAGETTTANGDPAFDRDKFLLRQKALSVNEKYIWDENGQPILYVERPTYLFRSLIALGGGIVAGFVVFAVVSAAATVAGEEGTLFELLELVAVLGGVTAGVATMAGLSAKRHVTFYRDDTKSEPVLEVLQDQKWHFITATFTIRDAGGRPLGALAKNYLYDIFRKRWQYFEPNGALKYTAREDSIILSLLRRLLGPLFGALRTNFVIFKGAGEEMVGEFNRKFTLMDRYVLDLNRDPRRQFDRRIALALGVMLDTGERR